MAEHAELAAAAGAMHAMTIVGCGRKEDCPAGAVPVLLEHKDAEAPDA